jgi:hypothetical protein
MSTQEQLKNERQKWINKQVKIMIVHNPLFGEQSAGVVPPEIVEFTEEAMVHWIKNVFHNLDIESWQPMMLSFGYITKEAFADMMKLSEEES